MDIDVPLRELGPVDSQPLIDAVLGAPEASWYEQSYRQEEYEVHKQTESLVMIFCDGWPDLEISKEPAWDLLKETAVPLMRDIIETHYTPGGNVIRAMAAKLKAGAVISPHWDSHESFMVAHRIHVPITTNPGVRFMINGRPYRFKVGEAYEINNQKNHSVMNSGSEDRITFIFDYLPPKSR